MNQAIAYAHNDVAVLAWRYDKKIADCRGFTIRRTDVGNQQTISLPTWVGFRGESNKDWKPHTSDEWPIQKFWWRDLTATRGRSYVYEIIPMVGKKGALKRQDNQKLTTKRVDLVPDRGSFSTYFNRGILSTQHLAHKVPAGPSGVPNYKVLIDRIDQPGDPLRNSLAGQIIDGLGSLLQRARDRGGKCYCALYELNDPELLKLLLDAKDVIHVILSNTGTDDATNDAARQTLHEAGVDVVDRMLKSGHIGHNKFVVYVDEDNQPQAVLTGSTNWTYSGLCGQANNALIVKSAPLAAAYFNYWKRLRDDGAEQSADFRDSNGSKIDVDIGSSETTVWFSPNTKQKSKPAKNPAQPGDMKAVFEAIEDAKSAILFLVFQPGSPSILDPIRKRQEANTNLFIRGAATDAKAVNDYNVDLYHRPGEIVTVVAAAAINDQFAFWRKELLKTSPQAHAIIHDKIVVIDPFSEKSVVITGSHNLGYRASYNNDENMLIIRGNKELAAAYAVHVMDIYDHYRWRWALQKDKKKAWDGLVDRDDWQNKYFNSDLKRELEFWF